MYLNIHDTFKCLRINHGQEAIISFFIGNGLNKEMVGIDFGLYVSIQIKIS